MSSFLFELYLNSISYKFSYFMFPNLTFNAVEIQAIVELKHKMH